METLIKESRRLHPMIIIAATAVTVFALAGTAGILGWIPSSKGETSGQTTPAPSEPVAKVSESVPVPKAIERAKPVQAKPVTSVTQSIPPASSAPAVVAQAKPAAKAVCYDCGVVESVREVEEKGKGSGLGAAAGGVLGGVLGNQVGSGRGRDVATVVGAVGGAVAGHQVEKTMKKTVNYEITVRFEDGTTRTLKQASAPAWRSGDKVRVVNSEIQSNS